MTANAHEGQDGRLYTPYGTCEDELDEDGNVTRQGRCTHDLGRGVLVHDELQKEDGPYLPTGSPLQEATRTALGRLQQAEATTDPTERRIILP